VPNAVVLAVAVVPLREPTGVDVRARLRPGVTPLDVEQQLRETIKIPMRSAPRVTLEELDGDEVVVHIAAVPESRPTARGSPAAVLAAAAGLARDESYPQGSNDDGG